MFTFTPSDIIITMIIQYLALFVRQHVKKTAYGAAGIAVESECMELGWRSTLMFDLQSTSNFLYICLHSMLPLLAFFPAFTFTQHDFNTNC